MNVYRSSLLAVKRMPEPGPMALSEEVDAYEQGAANPYFEAIDDSFVTHALSLGVTEGKVLDTGTGPGQIPIKIAKKAPQLHITGIDISEAMLMTAAQQALNEGVQKQVTFQRGDATKIPYDDHTFDMVLCNSVLHHVSDPLQLFNEINRVVKPAGAILLCDLRRPFRGLFHLHALWFGRYYHGLLKELYTASVRAAYTKGEVVQILRTSQIKGATVFTRGITHLGIQRITGVERI